MVGLGRGGKGRIARNKKARTRRASCVFRRLSETGLDSYLVEPGGVVPLWRFNSNPLILKGGLAIRHHPRCHTQMEQVFVSRNLTQ